MRTTHNTQEVASYQCPECEEVYSDRDEFFNHAIEHANMTLTCPLCKLLFENVDDVTDHVIVHSKSDMHFCDYCNLVYMSSEDLQTHFMDAHSEELCAVGEEIEFIVEEPVEQASAAKKRKIKEKPVKIEVKKEKTKADVEIVSAFDIEEDYEEDYSDQYIVNDMDGASFVEYEEIADEDYEPTTKPQNVKTFSAKVAQQKTYTRAPKVEKTPPVIQTKALPTKQSSQKDKTVKMTRQEIEQHKKAGRIEILPNGEMRMKQ
jgi:uncharacterized C2H2 Zn-finger protein